MAVVTPEHVSAIADSTTALAAAFAAWQGFKGLSAWRQERIGGRKIDLAEEALTHLFEMENTLRIVRSPFGYAHEIEGREVPAGESGAQKRGRDSGFRAFERIKENSEKIEQYQVTCIKVRAVFGRDLYEKFKVLNDALHKVKVAASMFYETPYEGYNDPEFSRSLERDLWFTGSKAEQDPKSIDFRVRHAIGDIESKLGEVIGRY